MKRILILATGGTIASAESSSGLTPQIPADRLLSYIHGIEGFARLESRMILNLDSSNIQPEEWQIIAEAVIDAACGYDGIVITHGTDTMAYTASVLSFMLMGVAIPVVMTGSQLPITADGSDGPGNLRDAVITAASGIGSGVYIVFDGKIMLGCRATKFRSVSFNAFESINCEFVGFVKNGTIEFNKKFKTTKSGEKISSVKIDNRVFLLKLIPGTSVDFFRHFIDSGYKGIVIEAFGVGGLHYVRRDLPSEISRLINHGIEVVVVSQCPLELADLSVYEVGKRAGLEGVISGRDMTSEAAVTKLMWALANCRDLSVKDVMLTNYCGEISE